MVGLIRIPQASSSSPSTIAITMGQIRRRKYAYSCGQKERKKERKRQSFLLMFLTEQLLQNVVDVVGTK
jgi:hypothetical protein